MSGHPTLQTDVGDTLLAPGMCVGFRAGGKDGHRPLNTAQEVVTYLEIGDRTPGDEVFYPDDDLATQLVDGKWAFVHKDGSPY